MFLGTPMIVFAFSKWHAVMNEYDFSGSFRFAWAISFATVLVVGAYAFGLPDAVAPRRAAGAALASVLTAGGTVSLLQLVLGDALLPRSVVFGTSVACLPWFVVLALAASGGAARQEERARVLFVGPPADAAALASDIRMEPERPVQLVGSVDVTELEPTVAHTSPLVDAARTVAASVVVLSRAAQEEESIVHSAAELHEGGVRIRTTSLFYEQWLAKLPVQELERISLMFDISELHRREYTHAKRLLDLAFGLVGCVVLATVVPFVALANLMGNRGPLLYRQPRVGKGDVHFQIIKFRTMRPDDGRLLNEWTLEDDPRITPFGRILRRTHLDELPQVVNIVRGDLSIVGPRPEQPPYVDELVSKLPFYAVRHLVRPGLTGWAQVKYGYAGSESDALEKLQYDFYYLRHQSLSFDLRIIGRTLRSVVGQQGR